MRSKVAVIGLVVLASLLSFMAGVFVTLEVLSRGAGNRLKSRQAYWTSTLDREIRIGEPKSEVDAWITSRVRRRLGDDYDVGSKTYFVITDTIEEPVSFPCASWSVAIEVKLGTDDRVTGRRVVTNGDCV
jgi:hypothetical protein